MNTFIILLITFLIIIYLLEISENFTLTCFGSGIHCGISKKKTNNGGIIKRILSKIQKNKLK